MSASATINGHANGHANGHNRISGYLNDDPLQLVVNRLASKGCDPRPNGAGSYESRCPVHDGRKHNLSIGVGNKGQVVLHCHHTDESGGHTCSYDAIVEALGLTKSQMYPAGSIGNGNGASKTKPTTPAGSNGKPVKARGKKGGNGFAAPRDVAEWYSSKKGFTSAKFHPYPDASRSLGFGVYRFEAKGRDKEILPVHLDRDTNTWRIGDPAGRLPLYNLPVVKDARRVAVLEGEKCADLAARLGLGATTSSHGAESAKKSDWTPLGGEGRVVAIFPDNDPAGQGYCASVIKELAALKSPPIIKVVNLPDMGDGEDIVEWAERRDGMSAEQLAEELNRLIEAAPVVDPSIYADADDRREVDQPHEADNDPARIAKVVKASYGDLRGNPIANHMGEYHIYSKGAYSADPEFPTVDLVNEVKAEINRCSIAAIEAWKRADDEKKGPKPTAIRTTRTLVNDTNMCLAAITSTKRRDDPPFWLHPGPGDPDPVNVISVRNGLLDVSGPKPVLMPHTPRLFSTCQAPYDYIPGAPEPVRFNKILTDQWGGDPESIESFYEVIGNLLTPETKYQRIHLWIGPKRSGRGTLARILTQLVGPMNVASTSAVALASEFGLQPLLGKSVAIMGDARLGEKHDPAVMVDRLLRISGEDPVEINRKGKPILPNVRMRARFLILSNELPGFRDASGAIVSRYHILKTTRTIPAEERNGDLEKQIIAEELPGILNLALEGLRRLRERGYFTQPASSQDLIDDAEEIASPHKKFANDQCLFHPDADITPEELYEAWCSWAIRNGYKPGSYPIFCKNFKSAFPGIKDSRPRDEVTGKQTRIYIGVELAPQIPPAPIPSRISSGEQVPY